MTYRETCKEHHRAPFTISEHSNISGHCINVENFTIVAREVHNTTKAIKEAMFIRVNDHPSITTLANSVAPISGMRSCRTALSSILGSILLPLHNGHTLGTKTLHFDEYSPSCLVIQIPPFGLMKPCQFGCSENLSINF